MKPVGRTILAVLAAWHGLAAFQNVCDILASGGLATGLRPLASKNLGLVEEFAKVLRLPRSASVVALAGASSVEAVACAALARGAWRGKRSELGFALSLALFGTFFLIDDALDRYDLGAKHRSVFTLLAAAYLATKPGPA